MPYHERQDRAGEWIERLAREARLLGEARMLRDDDKFTDEAAVKIAERFRELLKRADKTETWAARSMGIAGSTLSQVLSGTYAADPEKIYRQIDKWTEQQILRENAPKPAGFVKTSVAEKIYAVAKWICKINAIGVVHGPAGIGKTMTAQAIRAETPGSVYIRITTAGQSKLAVLEAVASSLRLTGLKMSSRQMETQIVSVLKDTNRLVIVDEVHKLEGRKRDEALHALRDLHDQTNCPMLWLGMSNIADYIQLGKANFEPLDQIASRIKWWLDLRYDAAQTGGGGGGQGGLHTIDDIRKVLAASKIRITPDGERYLQMVANEPGQGGLRTIQALAQVATEFAKGEAVNAELLRKVRRQQLGARAADQIERLMDQRVAKVG